MVTKENHPILIGFDSEAQSMEKTDVIDIPRSRRRTSLLSNMLQSQNSGLSAVSDDQSESSDVFNNDHISDYQGPNSSSNLFNDEESPSSKCCGHPSSLPSSPIPIPNVTYLKNPQHIEERNRLLKAMMVHRTRAELESSRQ
jgi:hypothetical protein